MAKILRDDDKFIVNRSDVTTTVEKSKLMAEIQDTDLLVVNRNGSTFKVTGSDLKDSIDTGGQPGASNGNGSVTPPQVISPVQDGTVDNPYTITLAEQYSAAAEDPYEKTVVMVAVDEDFNTVLFQHVTTDQTELSWKMPVLVEAGQKYWLRVGFYSTSGARAETLVTYNAVADPTLLEPFVETFYKEDGGSFTVTVNELLASHQELEVWVYLASGGTGGTGGNTNTNKNPGSAGSRGVGYLTVAHLTAEQLGWTDGQSFTFTDNPSASIYNEGYRFRGNPDLELWTTPSSSSASSPEEAYIELATLQPFYTYASGAAGTNGVQRTGHEGDGEGGRGGQGGGAGVITTSTGNDGSGFFPDGTVVISLPPDVSAVAAGAGSAGTNKNHQHNSKVIYGGTGGEGGTGWGAGGGGGGGAGGAQSDYYPHEASGGGGGNGVQQMVVVVKALRYPDDFKERVVNRLAEKSDLLEDRKGGKKGKRGRKKS